jgi:hypothetical protein
VATSIRVSGLTELVVDLDKVTSRLEPEVMAVLGKAGLAIKRGTQRRWGRLRHLKKLAGLVSYDVAHGIGKVYVEVGPQHVGQGELANVAEFGTVNNAPIPALSPELDIEEPKTVAALDALLPKLLDSGP